MNFIHLVSDDYSDPYPEWGRFAIDAQEADPFCCTAAWQFSFQEAFSPRRRILVAREGKSALLFAEKIFPNGRIVLTPVEASWFFGSPLLGENPAALLDDSMDFLRETYGKKIPEILISGIRPEGKLFPALRKRFMRLFKFIPYQELTDVQCAASLENGLEGFLFRRSAHERKNLKREFKRAREKEIRFERVSPDSVAASDEVYARMLAVEKTSWKGRLKCGMTEMPAKMFYAVMLRRLAVSRFARVVFAKFEGKDVGFIFGGIVGGQIYRGQQFSYAEDWAAFSIGHLLQMEQIAWLCQEGVQRYDMGPSLREKMAYKRHWTEQKFAIQSWFMIKK
ncbi:MAG: GNAT family N-acetyltransferase [Zoogloeaceae bacterium]|jgi:hypothetical protein|nr:GNAT family N-acetyltransferase [Zoogloeaceae bacterium]